MYCNKCGTQNPNDAKFCSSCGEKVINTSYTQEKNNQDEIKVGINEGNLIEKEQQNQEGNSQKESKSIFENNYQKFGFFY